MAERFLDGRVILHCGDCLELLAQLDENSLDSCVTDPPYHLTSIVQRFGAEDAAPPRFKQKYPHGCNFKEANGGTGAAFARMSRGFMGKVWDGGSVAFDPDTWRVVFRVLKPGAHLIAMGGTRTYHRMACAIEDAGFEIRDTIAYLYGSGFPKSHSVTKGARDAICACEAISRQPQPQECGAWPRCGRCGKPIVPDGLGTALKPACELIVLARKPLSEGTVAANVLRWGTGAINVDGCRVATDESLNGGAYAQEGSDRDSYEDWRFKRKGGAGEYQQPLGRWPANVAHDGSDEVVAAFPETTSGGGAFAGDEPAREFDANSGSAARFFYTAKADADDRLGSKHPTVKPLDLMQWLVRLVTPPGGTVLDPFAGTGTTGEAAFRELTSAVLIEAEPEYCEDIRRRMRLVLAGPDERNRESIKAKGLPVDHGPLFDWGK